MKKDYLIILLLISNLTCAWFWYASNLNVQEARGLAEMNAIEAVRQSQLARLNEQEANKQRLIAEQNTAIAQQEIVKRLDLLAKVKGK
jgi:hypothetical protein